MMAYVIRKLEIMAKEIYHIIGERIRTTRKSKNLTQESLVEQAGIDRSHMGFIEQGRRRPTIATLKKITDALGITLEELFCGL